MKILINLLIAISFFAADAQTVEYVCTPCGNSCDNKIYLKPGTCSACNMKLVEKSALKFKNLSAQEFCSHISNNPNAILLDVRTEGEFKGTAFRSTYGHFKNAININVEDLEARMKELDKYKDREVLVYCSHSVRSPRAAMMLTQKGFKQVTNMSGGVSTLKVSGDECLKKNFVVHE
jgi:rhodanese-related sulfurtransferase